MGGRGSGGANAISIQEHLARGTFRPGRHGPRAEREAAEAVPVAAAERRRVLTGLPAEGRRVAAGLLDAYDGWDTASLATLRQYAISCARLAELTDDDGERRQEVRTNLALLKALELDR